MQFKTRISYCLALLVLVTTLPVFVVLVYSSYAVSQARQAQVEAELQHRADELANEVTNRIENTYGYVNNLAQSNSAVDKDIPALYRFARRIQESNRNILAVSLIDAKQDMLFLSARPLGEHFPTALPELARQVFDTRAPNLSGPFKAPISTKQVVALSVPVMVAGDVAYCLRGIIPATSINALIERIKLPPEWLATVTDGSGTIVARSQDFEKYVGQKSAATLLEAIRVQNWAVRSGVTIEGVPTKSVLRPVGRWGWYVSVGVPTALLTEPVHADVLRMGLLGAIVALLSAVSVAWLSRRIVRAVQAELKTPK